MQRVEVSKLLLVFLLPESKALAKKISKALRSSIPNGSTAIFRSKECSDC